jgi:hypothetical protein
MTTHRRRTYALQKPFKEKSIFCRGLNERSQKVAQSEERAPSFKNFKENFEMVCKKNLLRYKNRR